MSSLSLFTSTSLPAQATDKAYGVKSADLFRVSSSFDISSEIPAYAMVGGTILLQQQDVDPNKVNLILRPHNQKELKLPIKYVIYRGLKTTDFINNTNLSDINNKVKTSGNELLVKMQAIQNQRAPGTDIPVKALFGNELSPVSSKNIDDFFFKNLDATSQLFTIDCGIEFGKFAVGEIGIEIILENPEYFVTVEIAKKNKYEINVSGTSDAVQKKWQKDLVRHFVDPAAFYGLHYDIKDGIEYRQGVNKPIANTPALVYQNIIDKFFTKNKVYLDIRNENGYSYNYYNNYVGSGTDGDKELKIGQTAAGIIAKEYYTDGWAIHIVDVTAGSGNENEIFLALRVNDNERPLLAGWNVNLTPNTVIDPPLSNPIANRIYFTDETVLLPTGSLPEFTNIISFKVPNVSGSTPVQLATVVRLDYIKQSLSTTATVMFPRKKFTDYIFGSTNLNIPWDTDDKIAWFTDSYRTYINAITEIGFGGFIESGHIIDIDTSTSDNDRIILYSAPLNFFSYKGIEKDISFNAKGGVLNYDSVLNIIPDIIIKRTNLKISSTQNILSFSYTFKNKLKKAFFMLGITKGEWQTAINSVATALSNIHLKLFKLKSLGTVKTDLNGTKYYDYEIIISGLKTDGTYQEVSTGITIYTLDHFIFSSKSFAVKYQIDYTEAENNLNEFYKETLGVKLNPNDSTEIAGSGNGIKLDKLNCSQEEVNNLEKDRFWTIYGNGEPNKNLFKLDPTMKDKITQFKIALDTVQDDYNSVKTVIETKGADLLHYAKQRIREQGKNYTNKDGILYLARLIMQVVLKNHPKLLTKYPSKIEELSDIFEKYSRGLEGTEKPIFSPQTTTHFNVLISGYDPFGSAFPGSYYDWQDHQSNPSGNLALALDGENLSVSGKTLTIKSVILPVRFREFDNGWIESFFTSYINDNNVKMIITFSYGVDGNVYGFEIERFASRNRGLGIPLTNVNTPDNNKKQATASSYLNSANKDNYEFIETTLPFNNMYILNKVGLDQKAEFNFLTGISVIGNKKLSNPYGDDDLKPIYYNQVKFPNLTNYPLANANKIKSVNGSGGDYLSNEVYYRVAFLRATSANTNKMTGHIHVGYLKSDPITDRTQMLDTIKQSIEQALNSF